MIIIFGKKLAKNSKHSTFNYSIIFNYIFTFLYSMFSSIISLELKARKSLKFVPKLDAQLQFVDIKLWHRKNTTWRLWINKSMTFQTYTLSVFQYWKQKLQLLQRLFVIQRGYTVWYCPQQLGTLNFLQVLDYFISEYKLSTRPGLFSPPPVNKFKLRNCGGQYQTIYST